MKLPHPVPLRIPILVVAATLGIALAPRAEWALAQSDPSSSAPPRSLATAVVVSRPLEKMVAIPGDLSAYQSVSLAAKVAGFVESVEVDRGSWVKRGQILARLTAPELRAQRAESEAKLGAVRAQQAEADAQAVAAQSTYDRLLAASATPGVVAGHDLEIAQRKLEAARAHGEALQKSADAAEAAAAAVTQLEVYLKVTAPFDGVITERNVHPGSLVGPSTGAMLRIEQIAKLRLTVPVPESHVASIAKGGTVRFEVLAFPDRAFHGTIARQSHSLDMKTRSMMVELDVDNADLALAPGMFAQVEWPITRSGASLFVPRTAVVRTSERQVVVRVRDGAAEWVDVRRGELVDDLLEVFGDLREGDVVLLRGSDEIRPGTKVAPAPAKT